ncbi:hypothetical protein EJ419_03600 [Alloscardovia theropitheci]|uniref:Uncharacterized protein n=1 Tax=Alloscardovia theropitheci TaxID=2496842 RepID=A0A4R0QPI9_9BIFI|nr:hypothetical protein [Alloscardovia theropitheci]TCD54144.1 hypothetical protein EJ419_03600 [Alloscardovia theropitheci]
MNTFLHNVPQEVVSRARKAAERLEALWPLTDAKQLDNDVHYGDNLQVRQTFQIAKILLGTETQQAHDLTIADAEYVFEGAEDIPGRNQALVDALLIANDAYEQAYELADDFDALQILQVAACVAGGESVSADLKDIEEIINRLGNNAGIDSAATSEDDSGSGDVENVVCAFAIAREIAALIEKQSEGAFAAAALMILVANGYLDFVGSPRTFMNASELLKIYSDGIDSSVERILESSAKQWDYHHDEILWDKNEAKRKAKEEDEAKSKAALAAKFARVQDDPNKPEVEL